MTHGFDVSCNAVVKYALPQSNLGVNSCGYQILSLTYKVLQIHILQILQDSASHNIRLSHPPLEAFFDG